MLIKLSFYVKVGNFYVAAGFNSGGIANAGGTGMALAEWITAGEPTMDLSSVDIRRFAPHHSNKLYLQECVRETLSWHYLLRFPYSERIRARGLRCSPLFSMLDAAGASWGDRMGWEVAKWFSLPGQGTDSSCAQVPSIKLLKCQLSFILVATTDFLARENSHGLAGTANQTQNVVT